jgi:hypothetical protein
VFRGRSPRANTGRFGGDDIHEALLAIGCSLIRFKPLGVDEPSGLGSSR